MSLSLAMLLWSSITARGAIDPIVVAAPAGGDSSMYLVVRNSSYREDRLLGVTCACADRVELVAADDSGPDALPLALPPSRLVELRPGGRHLVLRGLRQPLVAGQTVNMIFRYSDGTDDRDVRIVAEAEAGWAAQSEERVSRLPPPLQALAGWCWRGSSSTGHRTEARCFSPAYGWFMQDRHVAGDALASTTDHSLYSADIMSRTTHYQVVGADGAPRYGSVMPTEEGVSFVDYTQSSSGGVAEEVVVHWTRDGPDAWQVAAESRRPGARRELWRLRMVRAERTPPL